MAPCNERAVSGISTRPARSNQSFEQLRLGLTYLLSNCERSLFANVPCITDCLLEVYSPQLCELLFTLITFTASPYSEFFW